MYKELEQQLSILLGLTRTPVGIRFLKTAQDFEESAARLPHENGLPYCTAVAKATRGASCKLDARHCRCAAASTAMGMLPPTQRRMSGEMHAALHVYKDVETSRAVAQDMVYCKEHNYGVEILPLPNCTNAPDVVLLILTPKSAMRVLQGYAFHYGQLKDIKMAGMCAICQECTSHPFVKQDMNISLLCSGTRCVGQWDDSELAVGIPFPQFETVVDGILKTVNPMELDKNKALLAARMKESQKTELLEIEYHKNYFSKSYGIPDEAAHLKE